MSKLAKAWKNARRPAVARAWTAAREKLALGACILQGDVLDRLRELPDGSVHCCVTSPPYWGLRDYGTATWEGGDPTCDHLMPVSFDKSTLGASTGGRSEATHQRSIEAQAAPYKVACKKCGARRTDQQIGLEATVDEWVARMVEVFREVRRVLRDDGTLWLNLGDSYANTNPGSGGPCVLPGAGKSMTEARYHSHKRDLAGLKPKDLIGQPWRVAFALQADGWWLRSDIIWHKPNPMPESVTDRPTKSHEYLFLLTKSPRYFYDAEAIRERDVGGDHPRNLTPNPEPSGGLAAPHTGLRIADGRVGAGRNARTVWTIPTQPYPDAHFATFPEELPRRCILAGTSERGVCPGCGAPWVRVAGKTVTHESGSGRAGNPPSGKHAGSEQATSGSYDIRMGPTISTTTIGWRPTCDHYPRTDEWETLPRKVKGEEADVYAQRIAPDKATQRALLKFWEPRRVTPATVLDPFAGSGTTLAVARQHGRFGIGIELNPEYIALAEARIAHAHADARKES